MITFDLNRNDADALLRHCLAFKPSTGDGREDARLGDALSELVEALKVHLDSKETAATSA